jgi:hypothetical protein
MVFLAVTITSEFDHFTVEQKAVQQSTGNEWFDAEPSLENPISGELMS